MEKKIKTPINYIWLFVILAIIIGYVHFDMTVWSYNCNFHGIGSMADVMQGEAPAPTQYRILVPAIYGFLCTLIPVIEDTRLLWVYEPMKMFFIFLALWSVFVYMGLFFKKEKALLALCLMFLFLTLTFFVDYPEQFLGLVIFSMAFIGIYKNNQGEVTLWTVLGALNKETAFIIPVFNFLVNRKKGKGWIYPIAAFGVTSLLVRILLGFREYYTHFWTLPVNIRDFGKLFECPVLYGALSNFIDSSGEEIFLNKVQILAPYWNPIIFVPLGFGLLLYYTIKKIKHLPPYFKQGLVAMGLFFIISLCITQIREIRVFSWYYLLLIPGFLWKND